MSVYSTLYNWIARRAGGAITIHHSTGKLTGIVEISVYNGQLQAMTANGHYYNLSI